MATFKHAGINLPSNVTSKVPFDSEHYPRSISPDTPRTPNMDSQHFMPDTVTQADLQLDYLRKSSDADIASLTEESQAQFQTNRQLESLLREKTDEYADLCNHRDQLQATNERLQNELNSTKSKLRKKERECKTLSRGLLNLRSQIGDGVDPNVDADPFPLNNRRYKRRLSCND